MFRNTELGSEQTVIGFRSINIGKERRASSGSAIFEAVERTE